MFAKEIEWKNGIPCLVFKEAYSKPAMSSLIHSVLALPYEMRDLTHYPEDAQYEGLTYGEVMIIRRAKSAAHGESEDVDFFADRVLGKPKQSVESTTMSVTFQEYVANLERPAIEIQPLDLKLIAARPELAARRDAAKILRNGGAKSYEYAHEADDL